MVRQRALGLAANPAERDLLARGLSLLAVYVYAQGCGELPRAPRAARRPLE